MTVVTKIKEYWLERMNNKHRSTTPTWIDRKRMMHEKRGASVVRITADGVPYRSFSFGDSTYKVEYDLYATFLVKQGGHFYIEEGQERHAAFFEGERLVKDVYIEPSMLVEEIPSIEYVRDYEDWEEDLRFEYDRQKAVQYANRWWNSYNPAYKQFENDCTNFISQCLRAGGAPMWGSPARGKGWWYSGGTWSYSWTVANALRWYLSGAKKGLKGTEVERARELIPGDVICYDFEGDGRWNHNTIVVDKDAFGEPLVNAHTYNSYHRYWDYEDSTAYTANIKYKFFRIGD